MTGTDRYCFRENTPNGWLSIDAEDGTVSGVEVAVFLISSWRAPFWCAWSKFSELSFEGEVSWQVTLAFSDLKEKGLQLICLCSIENVGGREWTNFCSWVERQCFDLGVNFLRPFLHCSCEHAHHAWLVFFATEDRFVSIVFVSRASMWARDPQRWDSSCRTECFPQGGRVLRRVTYQEFFFCSFTCSS